MPLLFWADEQTGDERYADAVRRHTAQLREHILRADDTTFHTFYWDAETGEPLRGETEQGAPTTRAGRGGRRGASTASPQLPRHRRPVAARGRAALRRLLPRPPARRPRPLLGPRLHRRQRRGAGQLGRGDRRVRTAGARRARDRSRAAARAGAAARGILALTRRELHAGEPGTRTLCSCTASTTCPKDIGVDEGTLWGDYFYLEALTRAAARLDAVLVRFVTFAAPPVRRRRRRGIGDGDRLLDLGGRVARRPSSSDADALRPRPRARSRRRMPRPPAAGAMRLCRPVVPGKIICLGYNYRGHVPDGSTRPPTTRITRMFSSRRRTRSAGRDPVVVPTAARTSTTKAKSPSSSAAAQKRCRSRRALDHVAGYTILNDVSDRAWQRRQSQWALGKCFDGFAPLGPWIVTADDSPTRRTCSSRSCAMGSSPCRNRPRPRSSRWRSSSIPQPRDDPRAGRRHFHRHSAEAS